jgi:hypothetical protein
LLDKVLDPETRIERWPEIGIGGQFAIPSLRCVLCGLTSSPDSQSDHVAGSFAISKFFMSAATRSCPAFLMASDRFDPGGNFFACSKASEARAAQS